MLPKSMRVYVLGDQTFDVADLLSAVIHSHDHALVQDFVEQSYHVLKRETCQPTAQSAEGPRFSKILDLIPHWRAGTLNPALASALTCITHLSVFIKDHGYTTSGSNITYPTANDSCLTGICTGLISAAAISHASSVSELVVLGLQSVAVAFRVGACAWDVGSRLTSGLDVTGRYRHWTAAIVGLSPAEVDDALEAFSHEKGLNSTSSPWISAQVGPSQLSISAQPQILEALLEYPPLASRLPARLPIAAPYHAPHLFSEADVDLIVNDLPHVKTERISAPIPITSDSSGELIDSSNFNECLRLISKNVLLRKMRWDLVPEAIACHIRNAGCETFTVFPVAACSPDRTQRQINAHFQTSISPNVYKMPPLEHQLIPHSPSRARNSKIAIIGMSGRFPHASSMEAFWDVLSRGIDTHEMVPPSRWDHRTHVNLKPSKNVSTTGFGCWLHDAAAFDVRFFNMSPREAPQVDPAQRLALLSAAEALEQAGIVADMTSSTQKNRVGVYFGSTSNDWMETNSAQDIDTYFIPGGNRAFIPGRINYHFKFSGPSYTIDTACSSSLTAIHLACNALWRGEVDTAIVGGSNVLTNPDMHVGLDRGHFLSSTGNCKTFDESADGYCRGEAVVTAVFKRLDDAIQDRDPIQACILAVGTNHSAEADSITRPHVAAQKDLIDSLLVDTGVDPSSISYVEMHGTGTQAGDAAETASVLESLAPVGKRSPSQPLHMGAAKSNVGHGEAAAGATSLAKILLMLKHSEIPPHCGIKTKINSKIPDLKSRETHVAKSAVSWPRPTNGVRRVLLNNFSAAGGNTALILEDPPMVDRVTSDDPRGHHVVAVSAKTATSLQQNVKSMIAWIDGQAKDASILPQLSYTTTARRNHYPHRVAITGSDLGQVKASLQQALERGDGVNRQKGALKCIFSFTGQGSHFAGMGAELYSHYSSFRKDIAAYNQLSTGLGFPSIRPMFESADAYTNATPTMTQLATVCLQMALCRLWQSFGVLPTSVVGHSLGEYSALYAAGVLSQADVIYLVGRRAQLLESLCERDSHSMLAVRSSVPEIETLLGPSGADYEVSCINGSQSIVLGGTKPSLQSLGQKLKSRGLITTSLDVAYAFHTEQVDPILVALADASKGIKFAEPRIPIISPACGGVARTAADLGSDFVVRHCRGTVKMLDALRAAQQEGVLADERIACIEIGPAMVVAKMVKEVAGPSLETFASMRSGESTWKFLPQALAKLYTGGMTILWPAYHKDFEACQTVLEIPAYSWELKDYWIQYRNNWSLRKGDPPLTINTPSLESSSIHKAVQDTLGDPNGQLIVESDLSREDLHPMVQGHQVYGVPLCTPSVYADIALTIGQRVLHLLGPYSQTSAVDVADMTINSALVANCEGLTQILRTTVTIDETAKTAKCTFSSTDANGKIIEQHAHCTLRAIDTDAAQKQWQIAAPSILARMSDLQQQTGLEGNTYRFSKSMIYKMIARLADFDPNYRGLVEITLDNDAMEATGRVSFKDVQKNGKFNTNPAFIDALSQLGGFVMNANETVDLDKEVFVNHGWGSLQLFRPIDPDVTYYSHVKMSEGRDKLWTGDVVIFDRREVVAVFGGVALQNVPKRLMEYIVTTANKKANPLGKTVAKPVSKVIATRSAPVSTVSVHSQKQVTKTVETVTDVSKPSRPSLFGAALDTISKESGIAASELTDDCAFDDIGMDSLLCLMVCSRLRDEQGIEIDSAKFLDLRTISGLKEYLVDSEPTQQEVIISESTKEQVVENHTTVSDILENHTTISGVLENHTATSGIWPQIVDIISQESGIATTELTDDTCFADVGVDSLLSLLIWSRLKDELGVDLDHTSPFLDFETLGSFRAYMLGSPAISTSASSEESRSRSSSSVGRTPLWTPVETRPDTPETELSSDDTLMKDDKDDIAFRPEPPSYIKPAWSLVLQGHPKTATQRLFLFPDGCGAATSYMRLPRISESTAVIAFNSPFMKNPHEMRSDALPEIITSYIQSVRRYQPHGPYHLGGWSAGGVFAYAIAQQLMSEGEEIASLQFLDSPAPTKGLDRLPDRFFDHCSSVGIFGNELMAGGHAASATEKTKVPEWLMPHFRATIELLHEYVARPMSVGGKHPKVTLIWAGSSPFEDGKYAALPGQTSDDPDTQGMKFLTERHCDFGAGDWADLFPGNEINVHVLENEHHFSMMRGDGAARLAEFMRGALATE